MMDIPQIPGDGAERASSPIGHLVASGRSKPRSFRHKHPPPVLSLLLCPANCIHSYKVGEMPEAEPKPFWEWLSRAAADISFIKGFGAASA